MTVVHDSTRTERNVHFHLGPIAVLVKGAARNECAMEWSASAHFERTLIVVAYGATSAVAIERMLAELAQLGSAVSEAAAALETLREEQPQIAALLRGGA